METSVVRLTEAVAGLAERVGGTPVIKEVEVDGGKMVVLAFPSGDYEAWLVSKEGVVQGLGYREGHEGSRLIPGGSMTTR